MSTTAIATTDSITIVVDIRERGFYDLIKDQNNKNIIVVSKVLDIGDIIIEYQGTIVCLIERKTIAETMMA